ncbi:MAG TPA: hypothetical protein VFV38_14615, partial [Ktedonobacteraceae bacterium]|nr:hypothetical protein [Ktedonobacteraceae bacterium]
MISLNYQDQTQYAFASQILQRADQSFYTLDAQQRTITISHEPFGRLLERLQGQQAVILPMLKRSIWLLAAPTLQQLEQARIHIQHLLVPAYAVFQRKALFSGQDPLSLAGAQLYPYGYYTFQSRPEYTDTIFQLLDIWLSLEKARPAPQEIVVQPTYGLLHERFQLALAAAQWDEAELLRREIQHRNLTSAENLQFLEIELLARQQRWQEIWQRNDFTSLARIPIPRAVRAALLTAFHRVNLLPQELQENWQEAIVELNRQLPQLGLLLTARLGITQGPVVQVFAYYAARNHTRANPQELDIARAELQELRAATNDPAALTCINALLQLCEGETSTLSPATPLTAEEKARKALAEENYDLAAQQAQQIADNDIKLILLSQIAFYTQDVPLAEEAVLRYWDLTEEQQATLQQRYRFFAAIYSNLLQLVAPATTEEDARSRQADTIKTWLDWFRYVIEQPDDPQLFAALERLAYTSDERFWQAEKIIELNKLLMELVVNDRLIVLPCVRDATRKLVALFLNDPAFPQVEAIYQELYESLYTILLAKPAREELPSAFILLRLADALLQATPGKGESALKNLKQWSGTPMLKMEEWVLETFELLIDYGLTPQQLASWCREWLEWLFLYSERAQWHTWLIVSRTIQPGNDLLQLLEQKLEQTPESQATDIISSLSPGYQIGIYSLREGAALRAR